MSILKLSTSLVLACIIALPGFAAAQESAAPPISAEDEARIDAVIEEAKQETPPVPAPVAPAEVPAKVEAAAPVVPAVDGKAVATISSSGEKITVAEEKKEPGKAVVTLSPEAKAEVKNAPKPVANKTAKKTEVAKKAPAKKFTPVVAKLPQPRLPAPRASMKPATVAKRLPAPKQLGAVKPVALVKKERVEIQKPAGTVVPLSAFELGRYQYCGDDRDCMVAVNGCCDCANGGEDVAVNRDRFEAFRSRFACLHVACGEKSVEPVCSSGVVSCINHRCRYLNDAAVDEKF